jgi:hypothetical protein
MCNVTYTYKDNPYPDGTMEHLIWYRAFVHGLNAMTRSLSHRQSEISDIIIEVLKLQEDMEKSLAERKK